jgi:hypothetical protein
MVGRCICDPGKLSCGGVCRDVQADVRNCGACNHACGGNQICSLGQCACQTGQSFCGGNICRDLSNDRTNCGSCGHVCPGTASVTACVAGQCVCQTGLTSCGGQCVNTSFDENNCGACGHVCASNQVCNNGACVPPP